MHSDPTVASRSGATAAQKHALGEYGERIAVRHLTDQGMVVLEQNWRCDAGELDIVLKDGRALVVCEVKTRSSNAFGSPLEGVTVAKAQRLRRLAAKWIEARGVHPPEVRIDVVGVLRSRSGPAQVEHIRGVG
ncbi:YraN family protein [Nocardioides massiliensis]|uniref:UPF0102 protein J2S59_002404 n=1 Tax=Nocardioides massiliensis TaxID=1325935 RepID=A0ABT9NQ88_9ACTN|nr:YraN family protein [Nocardioides massiliensis]MDP9822595.1 putative endonuclease [Nocardioides massiliensis]